MFANDKKRFAEMVIATFEVYGKPLSKMAVQMYWNVLERFDMQQVERGFAAHLSDQRAGQFPPKPADVIRHIEGSHDDRKAAGEYAWQRAYDAIGSAGRYASVAFDDVAIHYAIMLLGGWEEFCGMMEDEKPFRRKDFISAYTTYKPGLPYAPYFSGIAERENSGKGTDLKITFIGDRQKAIAVKNGGRTGSMQGISCETIVPALKVVS